MMAPPTLADKSLVRAETLRRIRDAETSIAAAKVMLADGRLYGAALALGHASTHMLGAEQALWPTAASLRPVDTALDTPWGAGEEVEASRG